MHKATESISRPSSGASFKYLKLGSETESGWMRRPHMVFVTVVGSMLLFVLYLTFTAQVSTMTVQYDLLAVTKARINASAAPETLSEEKSHDDTNGGGGGVELVEAVRVEDNDLVPQGKSESATSTSGGPPSTSASNTTSSPTITRSILFTMDSEILKRPVPKIANLTHVFENYAIYTEKCRIRNYDYKNKSVLEKFFRSQGKECPKNAKPFVFYPLLNITGGFSCIGFDANLSSKHYHADEKDWDCKYKELIRDEKYEVADKHYNYGRVESFKNGDCLQAEFIWIECDLPKQKVNYSQPLMMPLVKPVAKQVRNNNLKKKPLNVLVIGMDSVSRLNAHRQFPRTLTYLQTKKNFVELFGYNKIGVNSAPNQIPLLSGVRYLGDNLKARASNKFFDNETRFLWDDFDSRGYRTMFYEEQWSYGLFVYPSAKGFRKVPTTYWPRPMFQAIDDSKLKKNGNEWCIGPDFPAKHYLDYTLNTLRILGSDRPLFSYSWLSETAHDDVNGGRRVDKYFLEFFKAMDREGLLNTTAIFFVSDHGFRFGAFRKTELGRYEDMLPYGFVLMPDSYFEQYPQALTNLKANSRRLVTVYDLHVTMLELADAWDEDRVVRTPNGYSLFSNVIPEERSCADAGIDFEFCSCFEPQPYDRNSTLAMQVAQLVIENINEIVRNNSATAKCHEWRLGSIDSFSQLSEGSNWTMYFKISLKTEPAAQFEAAVEYHPNKRWTLPSAIDRTDWFSSHATCVKSTDYERYCYCK